MCTLYEEDVSKGHAEDDSAGQPREEDSCEVMSLASGEIVWVQQARPHGTALHFSEREMVRLGKLDGVELALQLQKEESNSKVRLSESR